VRTTCCQLLLPCRTPNNVKALLRAAQARIGLGPGEYGSAAGYLQKVLQQAQEQQLPTRGESMHAHWQAAVWLYAAVQLGYS
jgi:hypothetical protein